MRDLEATRAWAACEVDSQPPTHEDLTTLLALLDEAVELLTASVAPNESYRPWSDEARAFLARLGRDQEAG